MSAQFTAINTQVHGAINMQGNVAEAAAVGDVIGQQVNYDDTSYDVNYAQNPITGAFVDDVETDEEQRLEEEMIEQELKAQRAEEESESEEDDEESDDDVEQAVDDVKCLVCDSGDNEAELLLCDRCGKGFHTGCLNIPAIPPGDWYCPKCTRVRKEELVAALAAAAKSGAKGASGVPVQQLVAPKPGQEVLIYERVSTKNQNDAENYGRVGMNTQNNTLLKYALDNGLVVKRTVREVHSAYGPGGELKGLLELVDAASKGDCILVYTVSRFSRNVARALELLKKAHAKGAWVYAVSDAVSSHEEKFVHLLSDAQKSSELLSKNVRDARARIIQNGGYPNSVAPFGSEVYRDANGIRRLRPSESEQKVIDEIVKLRVGRHERELLVLINEKPELSNRGKKWTLASLQKVLAVLGEPEPVYEECTHAQAKPVRPARKTPPVASRTRVAQSRDAKHEEQMYESRTSPNARRATESTAALIRRQRELEAELEQLRKQQRAQTITTSDSNDEFYIPPYSRRGDRAPAAPMKPKLSEAEKRRMRENDSTPK